MKDINVLQRHIQFILDRPFYLDKWIGDLTFLSILRTDFNLQDMNKWFINRYLPQIFIEGIKCHQHIEFRLKQDKKTVKKAYLYYFTSDISCTPIKNYSKVEWSNIYYNFRLLRSNTKNKITDDNIEEYYGCY